MANILVTGGAGFIGGNFVRYWADRYPDDPIIVLDSLTYAGNRSTLAGVEQADLIVGDIRDTALVQKLLADRSIDTLVHFAAESHVDRSIDGPDVFIETNVMGTQSLLNAARSVWLAPGRDAEHRFHHISTDEVFGSLGPDDPPFSESSPYAPNSPYSASKAASDHLVRAFGKTFALAVTTSHCSNNFGPYQFPEKLIPFMLISALNGQDLPIYGDGKNVRDWLHVADHCEGIDACLKKGIPGETYNLGGGAERANIAIVEEICKAVDGMFESRPELAQRFPKAPAANGEETRLLIRFVADRPGHDRRYAVDDTKARTKLGYEPKHESAKSLQQTLEWYLENEAWWRPLVSC